MHFLRDYDTGMRRLGFLEILVGDCSSSSRIPTESLGSVLWSIAKENQDGWLNELGKNRGLKRAEVGRITQQISGRFVKLATEFELLTEGSLKTLTDLGRLFKLFRKKRFFIDSNVGQEIILIREFLRKDDLIFPKLVEHIVKSKASSTSEMFNWFVNNFIENTLTQMQEDLDIHIVERFSSVLNSYKSQEPRTKKRGYDRVKHIVVPRLENIVDLEIVTKKSGPIYVCSDKTVAMYKHICQPMIEGKSLKDDDIFYNLASIYGVSKQASLNDVLKETLIGFDALAEPPLKVVPTGVLSDYMCISSIISRKNVILPKDVEKIEKFLFKKFHGKVVFFEDMEGHVSHISIPDEIKEKILGRVDEYASQIEE